MDEPLILSATARMKRISAPKSTRTVRESIARLAWTSAAIVANSKPGQIVSAFSGYAPFRPLVCSLPNTAFAVASNALSSLSVSSLRNRRIR
jgi:hypothetical protein